MKVAIYSRVSTDKQSHDSQLTELRDYCQRRGWCGVTEFHDVISGAKFSRTGLERLMHEVRRGRLDAILCFKLDRLGRSLPHLAQLIGELSTHRVALVCPSQGIDTSASNPASQLQLNILMAIAEFERAIIQERVNAGLRAARARGVRLGRPPTLNQHSERVATLLREGHSGRAIARALNIPVASAHKIITEMRLDGIFIRSDQAEHQRQ